MKLKGKSRIQIGLLLLPGLLIFCIFTVYPIIRLFWMSFFKWDFGSFVNTIVYTLVTVPAQMILGLLVAILINSITRFKIGFRVAYYLPVITSWVIASLVFKYVFNTEGLLNYFLTGVIHVTGANIHWLDSRWGGMTVAMLLGIWKGIGWNMVVFLAALQAVPQELYESASLDGAGAFQKFRYVTLPGIRGTVLFVVLTWMYYKAFSTGKFGYSAALSFIIAFILGILAVLEFRLMQNKEQS